MSLGDKTHCFLWAEFRESRRVAIRIRLKRYFSFQVSFSILYKFVKMLKIWQTLVARRGENRNKPYNHILEFWNELVDVL